jgi:hypothetical protein
MRISRPTYNPRLQIHPTPSLSLDVALIVSDTGKVLAGYCIRIKPRPFDRSGSNLSTSGHLLCMKCTLNRKKPNKNKENKHKNQIKSSNDQFLCDFIYCLCVMSSMVLSECLKKSFHGLGRNHLEVYESKERCVSAR